MTPVDIDKLKERLLATEHRGQFATGGGVLGQDGTCETWGGEKIMVARNPDGAAAVQAIDALIAKAERVDVLEAALKPFADLVTDFENNDGTWRDLEDDYHLLGRARRARDKGEMPARVTVGDFRAARNALSPTTTEDQR